MEMMIVLLIVAVVAAATAPMIARKGARSVSGGAGGAVSFLGTGHDFGNPDNGASIVFGANRLPADANNAKLYLASRGANNPHIAFGIGNNVVGILGINNNNSITLGNREANTGENSITIGSNANTNGFQNSIAIGNGAKTDSKNCISIGNEAHAQNLNSVAIGNGATTNNNNSVVISTRGANDSDNKRAGDYNTGTNQIVLGDANTEVIIPGTLIPSHFNFPFGANNTITLGNENTTVILPGDLVVNGNTLLGGKTDSHTLIREDYGDGNENFLYIENIHGWGWTSGVTTKNGDTYNSSITSGHGDYRTPINFSDRRLKNVGKPFTGGLEELKKLDLYNFTFKDDKDKTPQVGVMAQDLQKVFPNAVWEGADKYLRIRWDEMFYAVINAIKELDNKITEIAKQVKTNVDLIKNMQAQIDEQKQINKNQQAAIEALEKRLANLEKN